MWISQNQNPGHLCFLGSAVAQWKSAWLETAGPRVGASPVSLHCGPWARHIYRSLVLFQPRKNRPYITERLLMGRKESNQTNKISIFSCILSNAETYGSYVGTYKWVYVTSFTCMNFTCTLKPNHIVYWGKKRINMKWNFLSYLFLKETGAKSWASFRNKI